MVKIIISGGGTGGHVFPAIAIANSIRAMHPDADILFIGARGKLEMEKVPAAGYRIEGLTIAGFQRRFTVKNLSFPFKVLGSMIKARKIVSDFGPDVAIGVGGFASGPVLRVATTMGIPALIQEQNSFPGMTNRLLAAKARKICVAFEGMEKYFPKEKLVLTGNPIRQDLAGLDGKRNEALSYFGLERNKTTVLVIGGSLGAKTVNKSVFNCIGAGKPEDNNQRHGPHDKPRTRIPQQGAETVPGEIQWLWQCGRHYFENLSNDLRAAGLIPGQIGLHLHAFIDRMDLAYSAADVVISRAGAITISELCAVGKPVILIPSPNVAEDHQSKNAMALAEREAAILIRDYEAIDMLGNTLAGLIADKTLQEQLKRNILALAVPDAADRIAKVAMGLIKTTRS